VERIATFEMCLQVHDGEGQFQFRISHLVNCMLLGSMHRSFPH